MTELPARLLTPVSAPVRFSLRDRLAAAFPPWSDMLIGAPCWGIQMALSALLALYLRNRMETSHLPTLILLYGLGGMFSWPFMLPFARFFARGRRLETRFAAFFVALAGGTVAMTAFLFAMDYRVFYSRWHAPFGTIVWVFQFVFTSANAVYQFAVLGLDLFLPAGLVCLIATSLFLAKRMR